MNSTLPFIEIDNALNEYLVSCGISNHEFYLSIPAYEQYGDMSTTLAVRLAKLLAKDKILIANEIKDTLLNKLPNIFSKIEVTDNGLVNIFFNDSSRVGTLNYILNTNDPFNFQKTKEQTREKIVIEHTSPNPNKAMHLGHLRNNLVGMSLANLLEKWGTEVVRDAVDNNRGIAIIKAMYGYLATQKKDIEVETNVKVWQQNKTKWYTPSELNIKDDIFVTNCYVKGEALFQNQKGVEDEIRKMALDWENDDVAVVELWSYIMEISHRGIDRTLQRIGNIWDKVWHESDHYKMGKDYVQKGLEKGIFKKLDDGAVLTQIEEKYNTPETILLKNDGTALYITQDIALTDLKKKHYNADKLFWVIGPEQTLAMKQLFLVCQELGIGNVTDFQHIVYGYMGLKDDDGNFKKMSSREGTVLTIDDLLDFIKEKISKLRDDIDSDVLEKLTLCAVKFSILKTDRNLNMSFDIDESVNIHGDSGIYIMYTYARINSILKEAENLGYAVHTQAGDTASSVVRVLNAYPVVMASAKEKLSTHPIAHYLLSLASAFNKYYGEQKILDNAVNQAEKLAVLKAVNIVIKDALGILGIETVERF